MIQAMARPKKKKPSSKNFIHEEIKREWFGCEPPMNLSKNVSQASDWVDQILRSQLVIDSLDEEEIKRVWKEVAGDFISANTEPVSALKGHIVLHVTQPAMRFHLEQMKGELLKKMQSHFGKGKIHSVKFVLG